ncbi:MAG: hypothetical protein CME36_12440 [unclassified Hahellaceae]|nr:hypothetical protein [Hahellaceae bacterium]|tara:strand:+ start:76658 stop:77776 length:1119 start_codon:yes stop_codon:yes gene_type:complete
MVLGSLLSSACSDGNSGSDEPSVGFFMGRGMSGVDYQTETQRGVTGARGRYLYYPGERVTFSIGPILIAENIQAKRYITPPDFQPELQSRLNTGTTVKGITTYGQLERDIAANDRQVGNKAGFLSALDDDQDNDDGIQLGDNTRQQIIDSPFAPLVNFDVDPNTFGSSILNNDEDAPPPVNLSPETALFNDICFPQDRNCNDSVSRGLSGGNSAAGFVSKETEEAYFAMGSGIFLIPEVLTIPAGDTSIWRVNIRLVNLEEHPVAQLQVVPYGGLPICDPVTGIGTPGTIPPPVDEEEEEDPDAPEPEVCVDPEELAIEDTPVVVHSVSPESSSFEFFLEPGTAPGEASIAVNVKLANDYRWYLKNFRIIIK